MSDPVCLRVFSFDSFLFIYYIYLKNLNKIYSD